MKLSDFNSNIKTAQTLVPTTENVPANAGNFDFNLIDDTGYENQDTKDKSGHLELFINSVENGLNDFINTIQQNEKVTSGDNKILSEVENLKDDLVYNLKSSATDYSIENAFKQAYQSIKNINSNYQPILSRIINNLVSEYRNIFINEQEQDLTKPNLVAKVRRAFVVKGYGYVPEGESTQSLSVGNGNGGVDTIYDPNIEDNRIMVKNEPAPSIPNGFDATDNPKNKLKELSSNAYNHLKEARDSIYNLYIESLNFTGDTDTKSDLVDNAKNLSKRLDRVLDLLESNHYKINRM